jgi:hypothetical protein
MASQTQPLAWLQLLGWKFQAYHHHPVRPLHHHPQKLVAAAVAMS